MNNISELTKYRAASFPVSRLSVFWYIPFLSKLRPCRYVLNRCINNKATPYDGDGAPIKDGPHTYATLAAAGMWSTPSDMLKMASCVHSAYFNQKTDWISQATVQEMLTNNTPTNEAPNVGIGFFFNMDDNGEILGFGHGGADAGFMSQLYIELDTGNGYAIMTNGNNGR